MSHVDRRPAPAAEFGPTWHPHLPPVIRGRDVVDVALPGDGAERGGAEKGPERPREGRTPARRTASASPPRAPARRTAEPPAPEPPIEGQTEIELVHHQPTLWSL